MIAAGARRTTNAAIINRSRILAITARRLRTGGMNATKLTNNWSATAAASGMNTSAGRGENRNGASTIATMTGAGTIATGMAIEIVTENATEPSAQFGPG